MVRMQVGLVALIGRMLAASARRYATLRANLVVLRGCTRSPDGLGDRIWDRTKLTIHI
jgi:hypothetical protein